MHVCCITVVPPAAIGHLMPATCISE